MSLFLKRSSFPRLAGSFGQAARRVAAWLFVAASGCMAVAGGSVASAANVTWFGPSAASNSNASMITGTAYTQNFGVAFTTGTSGTYSMGWLNIGLNTSNVTTGTGSFQVSLRNTTNSTPYSAVAGTTLYAADTISFTMPTSTATNFSLSLSPADFPNISSYVMSGTTSYSLILNSATPNPTFGLQRTTGYANGTTNNFYTVSDGFVALDTFRNNTANYTNTTNSYPTLSIAFGTTAVPEPSTLALAAIAGLGGLLALRKR